MAPDAQAPLTGEAETTWIQAEAKKAQAASATQGTCIARSEHDDQCRR
jgi:hypothetical protein